MLKTVFGKILYASLTAVLISIFIFLVPAKSYAMTEEEAKARAEEEKRKEELAKGNRNWYGATLDYYSWYDAMRNDGVLTYFNSAKDNSAWGLIASNAFQAIKSLPENSALSNEDITDIVTFSKKNAVVKGLANACLWAYTSGGIQIPLVEEFLTINDTDKNLWTNMYNFFIPFGIILLLMYFLLDIQNLITNRIREFDIKSFIMIFFKLMIGLTLIKYGPMILGVLLQLSNYLVNAISTGEIAVANLSGYGDMNSQKAQHYFELAKMFGEMNFLELLGVIATGGILLIIAGLVPQIVLMFQALSRKVEIILRTGIAPLALPDVYNGVSNSKALAYIKKYAVVLFYGFMMIAVTKICTELSAANGMDWATTYGSGSAASNMGALCLSSLMSLVYSFVAVGLISSSKQILSDALGV